MPTGKVILITGGASGIGLATVKELLLNNAKAVSILDISTNLEVQELQSKFTSKVLLIKCDITDKSQLEDAFKKTIEAFNQLDIVINNAGIVDEKHWERTLATNLEATIRGTYLALQKYLPKYKSQCEGVIINIASIIAFTPFPCFPMYGASKAGVVHLGRSLSGDFYYEKFKVRVLTICPGPIDTPIYGRVRIDDAVFTLESANEVIANASKVKQSTEFTAKSIMEILKKGEHGSVWLTEKNEPPYEVELPESHLSLKKKNTDKK